MVVDIEDIKTRMGIKVDTEDDMITDCLSDSCSKYNGFSDIMVKLYACYLVAISIKAASRVQKDDDVTYFKYDLSYWETLYNNQYEEELADMDTISDYGVLNIANVRVD